MLGRESRVTTFYLSSKQFHAFYISNIATFLKYVNLGRNNLPSVVAFNDGEILVGNPALDCNTDMTNILYDKSLDSFRINQ